jgi:signal transduction histidine kinase
LLYLLLFLVPTLAVGAGTLWLLHREQQRLNEQNRAADAARIAAIDARARLIAENIELIISDVETGLMTALSETPRDNPGAYLENWRRTNPLVENVCMVTASGAPSWGAPDAVTAQFIASAPWRPAPAPASAREFMQTVAGDKAPGLQRIAAAPLPPMIAATHELEKKTPAPLVNVDVRIITGAPITPGAPITTGAQSAASLSGAIPAPSVEDTSITSDNQRQQTESIVLSQFASQTKDDASANNAAELNQIRRNTNSGNVGQFASVRTELNAAANRNFQSIPPRQTSATPPEYSEKKAPVREQKKFADGTKSADGWAAADSQSAPQPQSEAMHPEVAAFAADKSPANVADESPARACVSDAGLKPASVGAQSSPPVGGGFFASGWTPWTAPDGVLHLYGWSLTSPEHPVILVEVNLAAIASRLGGILPVSIEPDEAYALRQHNDTVLHQIGFPRADSGGDETQAAAHAAAHESKITTVVPLASTLPSWSVAGYSLAAPLGANQSASRTFFLLGALLVAATIATILAGGSLLWRQARLSAAESARKTSFVANVSHEFKTPLTTIRLYSELLEQGRIRDDAKRAESLRTISRETQRLARLVNNVLDFSRLEQGRKKFNMTECDLRGEIAKIVERHAPRIAEAGLKLDLINTAAAASCVVKTDLDAVEQIVINLLDNACKYAAGGGEVTVFLGGTGRQPAGLGGTGTLSITVADRGPGIPSSHREKIFEKFHRVDDRLTAAQGGAGLGLGIARQLARGLGGDLTYSPREGGGGEFTLTLPANT